MSAIRLLLIGAVVRVFGPMVAPAQGFSWWLASGTLWAVAFAVYAVSYLPVLVAPRVDGRPG